MTKYELAEQVHKKLQAAGYRMTFKKVRQAVDVILDTSKKGMDVDGELVLRGFGTFATRQKNARMAHNPKTMEPAQVPAKRVVAFRAGKELKHAVNGGN